MVQQGSVTAGLSERHGDRVVDFSIPSETTGNALNLQL